ncbi:MAG: glycogen debranching protein, partial [Lentisphaerae bacterium]|nr:glycogen debranching protein [Lentisphaerota bacterium]
MPNIQQIPVPGSKLIKIRGDKITFRLTLPPQDHATAWLRSNIGYASVRRTEIINRREQNLPILASDWTDTPMHHKGKGVFELTVHLLETGVFEAKTYFIKPGSDTPIWPHGDNTIIKVEPWQYSEANSIYSAFTRQFGAGRFPTNNDHDREELLNNLEQEGFTVIPRSGTFRDLTKQLDFIINELGFNIIQLLPIHPSPTTYARMGRYGSPYAVLDYMNVDSALAEFDKKTTPLEQFQELLDATHARGARLILDIPINHTGWGSKLQIEHPEMFTRAPDMSFQSPGAWGVIWEDLAQLDYSQRELWYYMADVFLFWCRRGVDGFRCDAGYMIPLPVWKYIVAKVRREYPDTLFFLEGLGGKIKVMKELLENANLNWAYSELFQNYDRQQVERYLKHWSDISEHSGNLIHFAETHDNNRLAAISEINARMRTALSALTSRNGAFGITAGVEWFAKQKINVHGAPSLNWGSQNNQIKLIARLNKILKKHPAFGHDAKLSLIHKDDGTGIVLRRTG